MSSSGALYDGDILVLWTFDMDSFHHQHWQIFLNSSPYFSPQLFHQTKICDNLDFFLVLGHIAHSISHLFDVFVNVSLCYRHVYHNIYIFVHVRFNILRCKKMLKLNKVSDNMHQEVSRNLVAFLRQLKMAKTCVLVVSLCFLCYLPISVVAGIQIIWQYSDKTPFSVVNASTWATTLATMNSTLNCLIFFWGNNELRKEGLKIIKKYFHGWEESTNRARCSLDVRNKNDKTYVPKLHAF